jgi:hypothetical protein
VPKYRKRRVEDDLFGQTLHVHNVAVHTSRQSAEGYLGRWAVQHLKRGTVPAAPADCRQIHRTASTEGFTQLIVCVDGLSVYSLFGHVSKPRRQVRTRKFTHHTTTTRGCGRGLLNSAGLLDSTATTMKSGSILPAIREPSFEVSCSVQRRKCMLYRLQESNIATRQCCRLSRHCCCCCLSRISGLCLEGGVSSGIDT